MGREKKPGLWEQFKAFAFKGNVFDLAIGVIIGGAFGKIVSSMVTDIIMPLFGYVTAGMNFSSLKWVLNENATITYGVFLQNLFDFLVVAVSIFLFIQLVNKTRSKLEKEKEAEIAKAPSPTQEQLLTEIRDLLILSSNKDTDHMDAN